MAQFYVDLVENLSDCESMKCNLIDSMQGIRIYTSHYLKVIVFQLLPLRSAFGSVLAFVVMTICLSETFTVPHLVIPGILLSLCVICFNLLLDIPPTHFLICS